MGDNTIKGRIYGLDCAKALSTIAVVSMHLLRRFDSNVSSNIVLYYISRFAIPFFFMASGYILLNREKVSKTYCLTKIKNILFYVFSWIIIYDLFALVIEVNVDVCLDMYGWTIQKGSYSIFWFMFTLMVLYVIMPLLIRMQERLSLENFTRILFLLCMCSWISNIIMFASGKMYFWQESIPQSFRLWIWLFYFSVGGCIRNCQIKEKKLRFMLITLALTICAVFYQYLVCYKITKIINGEYTYDSLPVLVWCVMLFTFIVKFDHKLKSQIIVKKINEFSLVIYAIHIPLIKAIKNVAWFNSMVGEWVAILLVVTVIIIVGELLKRIHILKFMYKI